MNPLKFFIYQAGQKHYFVNNEYGDFRLTVQPKPAGGFFARCSYLGETPVEIHFGLEMPSKSTPNSYTLIPGIYYNGNNSEPTKTIPALTAQRLFRFEASASAGSNPVAMHYDGKNTVHILRGSPWTRAGVSGFVVTPNTVELVAPALEEKKYYLTSWRDQSRPGLIMKKNDLLSLTFDYQTRPVNCVLDLFHLLHQSFRSVEGYSNTSFGKMSLDQAADLVALRMLQAHHIKDDQGHSLFTNISEIEGTLVDNFDKFPASWFQLAGWCGGPMTAYALLKKGGQFRQAAIDNLDFMVATGLAPSGLAYSIYDGKKWLWEEDSSGYAPHSWKHIRLPADFLHYLLKALQMEEAAGTNHPDWRAAVQKGLNTFCALFEKNNQFGFRIRKDVDPPELFEPGSTAGAFVLQALAEAIRCFPEEKRYQTVYRSAADYYYENFVRKGHCTGGPLDIEHADDSESAAALTDAYTQGYLVLHDKKLLAMAEDTAQIFASWVLAYAAPFPPGSSLFGYNPCGGVIANVQNRHLGPGICTNSARFLHRLHQATGKEIYRTLYYDIIHAAVNFIAAADDEFVGYDRYSGKFYPFKKGVVSEQVNLTDALNESGEMWNVACSWPATAILLMWTEYEE
jgi:hypothetical protein